MSETIIICITVISLALLLIGWGWITFTEYYCIQKAKNRIKTERIFAKEREHQARLNGKIE